MSSRRRLQLTLAIVAFAVGAALPAAVGAQGLAAFEGQWQGRTIETGADLELAPSAFQLEIKQVRDGGFAARWTNPPQAGDGAAPDQIDARFAPSGSQGVFALETPELSLVEQIFARPETGNPIDGDTLIWARTMDDALILYSLSIGAGGRPALIRSAYRRDGDELVLERSARSGTDEPVEVRARLTRRR